MFSRSTAALLLCLVAGTSTAQVFEKDNGVIRIRMNDHAPIITGLWIDGIPAVPHDNIGADLQMAARSSKGDAYNPTQGGDCTGQPSLLTGVIPNWDGALTGVPASHGILLGVAPRDYNEPMYPGGCLGPGAILPYEMNFGVTLGDNIAMPKEVMVLEMSIRKKDGTAEDIVKLNSELPAMFVDNSRFPYAFYSTDSTPNDGLTFVAFNGDIAGMNHDTASWPLSPVTIYKRQGVALVLCDRSDALQNPHLGHCIGIYSHDRATLSASRRQGAYPLTLLSVLGDNPASPVISDYSWHTQRRLVLVGNINTISAAAAWAENNLNPLHWTRW